MWKKIKIFLNKIYTISVRLVCLDIKYLIPKTDLIRFRTFIRRAVWPIGPLLKIRFTLAFIQSKNSVIIPSAKMKFRVVKNDID